VATVVAAAMEVDTTVVVMAVLAAEAVAEIPFSKGFSANSTEKKGMLSSIATRGSTLLSQGHRSNSNRRRCHRPRRRMEWTPIGIWIPVPLAM
jgi:hypothetical protein